MVVKPAAFLVEGNCVGLKSRCVAVLGIDDFHAVHDNLRFRLVFRGRIVCQLASRFSGLEIDYDEHPGPARSDKGVACLCVQAHVIQIGAFRPDIFVQGYRLRDFVCARSIFTSLSPPLTTAAVSGEGGSRTHSAS